MRIILVFLILFLCAGRSFAEELIMGRVVSIDKSTGAVALEVLDGPENLMQEMKKAGAQPYRITVAREALSGPVAENSVVRVWGTFDEKSRQFRPARVYGADNSAGGRQGEPGYGRNSDSTGVRQRIGRGAGAGGSRGGRGGTQQGRGGGHGGQGGR